MTFDSGVGDFTHYVTVAIGYVFWELSEHESKERRTLKLCRKAEEWR